MVREHHGPCLPALIVITSQVYQFIASQSRENSLILNNDRFVLGSD